MRKGKKSKVEGSGQGGGGRGVGSRKRVREEGSEGGRERQGKETSISSMKEKCRMYVLQVLNIQQILLEDPHTFSSSCSARTSNMHL